MKRLGDVAEQYGCAVILIGHMNKAGGGIKAAYRGLGSIDFQAAARSVLVVGRLREQPEVRVVAHVKCSLAPEGQSFAFELNPESGFRWLGHYDISADDLLAGIVRESKSGMAESLLQDLLSASEMSQSEILLRAEQMGISKRVLDQAKKALGVRSVRQGKQWLWELSAEKQGCNIAGFANSATLQP